MKINQISLTIKYSQAHDLQRKYYDNRNILSNAFCPATVLPVPDDGLEEVPRLIIKSQHGHSEINISPIALTFNIININNGYENDWGLCTKYFFEKIAIIKDFLDKIIDNKKYDYTGVIVNLSKEIDEDASHMLAKNLLNKNNKDLYDLNVRYTFVEKNKNFINIQLQNVRIFEDGANGNIAGGLSLQKQKKNIIGVLIDVNDRYIFNNDIKYVSSIDNIKELVDTMTKVINEKIEVLIDQGEYKNV